MCSADAAVRTFNYNQTISGTWVIVNITNPVEAVVGPQRYGDALAMVAAWNADQGATWTTWILRPATADEIADSCPETACIRGEP